MKKSTLLQIDVILRSVAMTTFDATQVIEILKLADEVIAEVDKI